MKLFLKNNKVFFIFILIILSQACWANSIDSLEVQLTKANETEKIEILIKLSKAYWTISPSKGMFYSNEAIVLAEKYKDQKSIARALLYGGVNAWYIGWYDEAIRYYQRSLTIARELNDERLCAYNLNNLGMINTHLKNYEKAIENYTESSLIIQRLDDEIEYAKIENNIAGLNMLLGNLDTALEQHLAVLDIIQNSDEKIFLIWLYNDIGTIYKKKGNDDLALDYFLKSLDLSNSIGNSLGKSKTMNQIGEVYLKQKDYPKAKEYFFIALNYAKKANAKDDINECYRNISDYYSATYNYDVALEYYKLYKELSDSILNEDRIHSIIEMQARYDLESKEKENSLLRQNIEINDLRIKKKKIQISFLIALLLFTSLVIILIYSQLIIKKRKNEELNEKNVLINKQKNQLSSTLSELEILNEKLAETNATKDKFFSIIAHDLKSPFNSMLGFSKILDDEFDKYDNKKKRTYINLIHQGLKDTYKLLENLLQWAGSQRGSISFELRKTDLFELSDATCKFFNQAAVDKSIVLKNEIPGNISILADYNMIFTIFRNLVSNAIKFTPKGGEIIIMSDDTKHNGFIEIMVKDSGNGISEELQAKLFDIAGNKSTKGTEQETGTGLGLIICKEFVEKHNGKIWVESEPGKGSLFCFTIPYDNETKHQ